MKKVIYCLMIAIFLGIFAFSAWQLYGIISEYEAGDDSYSSLEQLVSVQQPARKPEDGQDDATIPEGETGPVGETDPEKEGFGISVSFDVLMELNPDTIGWLYIEDTEVNYPLVQSETSEYYLRRLFDGTPNTAGCLFMEEECLGDFSGSNSIIYGHNMKNGSMFADVVKYKQQEYYDEHMEAVLLTPEGTYSVKFFSGYVCKTSESAWDVKFTDESYEAWLEEIAGKSCFETDVVPQTTDRILTLSTCSYEFNNARFVLHGIIVDPQQAIEHK